MSNWIRPKAGACPTPVDVRAARCVVHAAAAEWGPFDVVRLATLIKLGRPAEVVSCVPAVVDVESNREGVVTMRARATQEAITRAEVLAAWRMVAQLAGWPLPPPHALTSHAEAQEGEEPRTAKEVAGAFASLSAEDRAEALKLILHLSKVPK